MKKALVLGASGGMGYSIVQELVKREIEVIAFARSKQKLEDLFLSEPLVTIYSGDIFHMDDLLAAAKDADVVFQAANLPYAQWERSFLPFMTNIIHAVKETKSKLVVIENIYAYGRTQGGKTSEATPKKPVSEKGWLRLKSEQLIKQAAIPFIIAHFPDFYGPNATNTLLHVTLQNVIRDKKAMFVGNQTIPREFIYTPDGAGAVVHLALQESAYGQNWNIPGYGVISGEEIIELIRELTDYRHPVMTVSKRMIRFLGLFNKNMREVVEMFYLNEEPVVLDGTKYVKEIGPLPRTPYREGLKQTIDFMRSNRF